MVIEPVYLGSFLIFGGKMEKYINKILVLALVGLLLFTSCAGKDSADKKSEETTTETTKTTQNKPDDNSEKTQNSENNYYPVTIKNYNHAKEPIEMVFEKAPERVYSVNPTSVDNMLALGLEDKIVKISLGSPDRLTEEGKKLYEKLEGQEDTLTKEEVLGNNIDFILGWYSTFDDKSLGEVDYWHDKGINTYIALNSSVKKPEPNTLEDEYEDIRNLGKIFNVEDRAEKIINDMEEKIAMAQEKVKEHGKTKTIILEVEKDNQLRLYGPETIGGVIAEKVGADLLTNEPRITAEELIALNPDVIFTVHFGPGTNLGPDDAISKVVDNKAFQSISAVENARVYPIILTYTYAPGVRAVEAIDYISEKLYEK